MSDERQILDLQFTVSTNRPGYLALYEPLSASEYVLVRLDYVESLEKRIAELEARVAECASVLLKLSTPPLG